VTKSLRPLAAPLVALALALLVVGVTDLWLARTDVIVALTRGTGIDLAFALLVQLGARGFLLFALPGWIAYLLGGVSLCRFRGTGG
jgi:hypothetical protein